MLYTETTSPSVGKTFNASRFLCLIPILWHGIGELIFERGETYDNSLLVDIRSQEQNN